MDCVNQRCAERELQPHISVILFVPGEPAQRDYVFRSTVR